MTPRRPTVGVEAIPTKNPTDGLPWRKLLDVPQWHQVSPPPEVAAAGKRVRDAVAAVKAAGNAWDALTRQAHAGLGPETRTATVAAIELGAATPQVDAISFDTQRATLAAKIDALIRIAYREKSAYHAAVKDAMPAWRESILDNLTRSLADLEAAAAVVAAAWGQMQACRVALESIRKETDPASDPLDLAAIDGWRNRGFDVITTVKYLDEWIADSKATLAAYRQGSTRGNHG